MNTEKVAQVALNIPIFHTFDYAVPERLLDDISVGQLVRVPHRTAMMPAVIVALYDREPDEDDIVLKDIDAIIDDTPVVTPEQIALSQWVSETTVSPLGFCLWLWFPSGLAGHRDVLLTLVNTGIIPSNALEAQIIDLLTRRGSLRYRSQVRPAINDKRLDATIKRMIENDIIQSKSILTPPTVRARKIDTAMLNIHPRAIDGVKRSLGKHSVRADLLTIIADMIADDELVTVDAVLWRSGSTKPTLKKLQDEERLINIHDNDVITLDIPLDVVDDEILRLRRGEKQLHILQVLAREQTALDVSWIYAQTDSTSKDLNDLEALELITLGEKQTWRDSLAERDFVPTLPPRLTEDQAQVWAEIQRTIPENKAHTFLLHGVTGSGKTEIYLRAIAEVLRRGQQAIFLVPEIALTAQTTRRVAARFPGKVAVVHSRISEGERFDTWRRARAGEVRIVVGARSALFTPFPNLGLIVIDEEHDTSYKNFASPTYDTRTVAEEIMRRNNGTVIMGSATPALESMYRAERGDMHLLRLPQRIMAHSIRVSEQSEREGVKTHYQHVDAEAMTIKLPDVEVIDMREELHDGNTSIFSRALSHALEQVLANGEQAILLLNRRGTATYVFCRDCGYVALSPASGLPLTYHGYEDALIDHHSGQHYPVPTVCPECASNRIKFFGAGTQHIVAELESQFFDARVVRWDSDIARNPEMHDAILTRFVNRDADIMVGTQMVAKGLDLPMVTLVGVVSADVGLGLPDFRAGERTFQLLTQVAGRAGRGILGGRVILQTYQPEHYAIQAAAEHDTLGFYERELAYRRELGYPPFRRMARLLFKHKRPHEAQKQAEASAEKLREYIRMNDLSGTDLIGPAPCFYTRLNDEYRWHILIRSPDPLRLVQELDTSHKWLVEIDPLDVL